MSLAQNYASALLRGADASKTVAYMKAKGHLTILPEVVRALERAPKDESIVSVAREADVAKAKQRFPKSRITLDPKIVGGYFARTGSKLIDASFRKVLVDIYKKAIS